MNETEINVAFNSITFVDGSSDWIIGSDLVNFYFINTTFYNNSPPNCLIQSFEKTNITSSNFLQNHGQLLCVQGNNSNVIVNSNFTQNDLNEGDMVVVDGNLLIANSFFDANKNAIRVESGSLSVVDSDFEDNSGCITHSGSNLLVTNTNFNSSRKIANQSSGGAIQLEYSCKGEVLVNITSSNFNNNLATSQLGFGLGGAISINSTLQNEEDLSVSVTNCTFAGNVASGYSWSGSIDPPSPGLGGAISFVGIGSLHVENVLFEQNAAVGGDGIAIVTLNLWGNEVLTFVPSGANGGAIFTVDASVSIQSCVFKENTILPGSFIYLNHTAIPDSSFKVYNAKGASIFSVFREGQIGSTDIADCSFVSNSVNPTGRPKLYVDGGVIYSQNTLSVSNCTFESNSVNAGDAEGGLIYCGSDCALSNVTFSDTFINATANIKGIGIYTQSGTLNAQQLDITTSSGYGKNINGIIYSTSSVYLANSTFLDNLIEADEIYGGVLTFDSVPPISITVTQCTFANTVSSSQKLSFGGALWMSNPNSTISNCSISFNSAAFGGGCAINSAAVLANVEFNSNTAYRAGGAVYFLDQFSSTELIEFCDASNEAFNNNTSPSGAPCASIIIGLGFPPYSVPFSFVYPYQEFTLAFALVDQFGNILEDLDTKIIANTNLDTEFSCSLSIDAQPVAGVYFFPDCKFAPSTNSHLAFHEITFQSVSASGKFNYLSMLNFTVTTCPPNTDSTNTTTACIPCDATHYSLLPASQCLSCEGEDEECSTLLYLTGNFIENDSEAMSELSAITSDELEYFSSLNKSISSLLKINKGYWPVPTANNFTNPTELLVCEYCLPFWCVNSYFCASEDCHWEVDCSYTTPEANNEGSEGESGGDGAEEAKASTAEEGEECKQNANDPRCCEGYTNRLCEKCDIDYFPRGEEVQCVKCSDIDWTIAFVLLDLCISGVLIIVALKFRHSLFGLCVELVAAFTLYLFGLESFWNFVVISSVFLVLFFLNSHVNHGILKCFIFYYQTSALVVRPLFEWKLPEFGASALTRNGLACYFPDTFPFIKFYAIMLIPVITSLILFFIYIVGKVYFARKLKAAGTYNILGDQSLHESENNSLLDDENEDEHSSASIIEPDRATEVEIEEELQTRESFQEKLDFWSAKCIKVLIFLLFLMYNLITKMVFALFFIHHFFILNLFLFLYSFLIISHVQKNLMENFIC